MGAVTAMNILLLGACLRACRLARQQTMKEFSELCGISERYLADIERGQKAPKLETFVKIANAAGVSPEYLLQDSLTDNKAPTLALQTALTTLPPPQRTLMEQFILSWTKSME